MSGLFENIGSQEIILITVVSILILGKRLPNIGYLFVRWANRRWRFGPGDHDGGAVGARLPKNPPNRTHGAIARPEDGAVTNL